MRPSGTGAFVFPAVRPGHYVVTARADPAVAAPPAPSLIVRMGITMADAEAARAADADLLWASVTIDVSGGDVEIAGLVLQPGAQMSGRLRFAGPPHPPLEHLAGARLRLSPAAALGPGLLRSGGFTSLRQARIEPDGSSRSSASGPACTRSAWTCRLRSGREAGGRVRRWRETATCSTSNRTSSRASGLPALT